MENKKYYVGLDMGSNSVGYAVTDENYNLLKHRGEPMWGSHVFEEANTAETRRAFRTARRREDRQKQRISLITEIFAEEIMKVDSRFFIRRKESALFREDVENGDRYIVFNDSNFTDQDFYEKYPTIHHLICELMNEDQPHDVRLVYIACTYLVAHRGHFLNEVNKDNIEEVLDFQKVYNQFMDTLGEYDENPWECDIDSFRELLKEKTTVTKKKEKFQGLLNNGKKFKTVDDELVSKDGMIQLLSGGTYDLGKLFPALEIEDKVSVSFKMPEDDFLAVLSALDDEADILCALRNLYDWATLADVLNGCNSISESKVLTYQQHKKDLKYLKKFIRKYRPDKFNDIFRSDSLPANYVAYSYHTKNTKHPENVKKKATKEEFCDYIRKIVKDISVEPDDEKEYEDMIFRLTTYSFLPKQVDGDNRVIPYQLYYYELKEILNHAKKYLPFLEYKDEDGYTNMDKILSIMEFRVPYYVGPLRTDNGEHGWMKRKSEGKIYPWNFETKVDLDQSEQEFISRMTNTCSYLPGETVLPKYSLLYSKFMVLNEINNIRINGQAIPVSAKQGIYKLFQKYRKVSAKKIKEYLLSNNLLHSEDFLSGIDITIKSSLKSFHDFKRLMDQSVLSEKQVESIIERLTYCEDKKRINKWLRVSFPCMKDEDIKYISNLKYNDFGRLSGRFLAEMRGCCKETGETYTIIGALWDTNDNLMQLLSDKYTFKDEIESIRKEYYCDHPATLESMLDGMYISNLVKRPIYRALDILSDIQKVCGQAPDKIFIEMARGNGEKGKRTKTRRDQIMELYKSMDKEEVRELSAQLEGRSDNELQSEVLFLYFMQLGKCAYTGQHLDIDKLKTNLYNVDHIYPQSFVKDDSLDNKVLVLSEENGKKSDSYPIKKEIRDRMQPFWFMLKKNRLISDEKYERLVRNTGFTDEEKMGFINRQLVETRQSTKAVATVLRTLFPETEVVYSKAGLVSDFRHEFGLLKCRSVNDLHHAKDAYLNIVVGNVYHCRFTKKFYLDQQYSLKTKTIFTHQVLDGKKVVWDGESSIEKVKHTVTKNNIHYTKFAFQRTGGLFDQMPLKASEGLVPRKKGLDPKKYGGYAKAAAIGFLLVKYKDKGKWTVMFLPVELLARHIISAGEKIATEYAKQSIEKIWGRVNGQITDISFPLGLRLLKINTMLSFDGFKACMTGKANGGKIIGLTSMMPLVLGSKWEMYVKKIESFSAKKQNNKELILDQRYDGLTKENNEQLFDLLKEKVVHGIYRKAFASQVKILENGVDIFKNLSEEKQITVLLNLVLLLKCGRSEKCDLTLIGGSKSAGTYTMSSSMNNLKGKYNQVKIVDSSPSGIFESDSLNLLDLLS